MSRICLLQLSDLHYASSKGAQVEIIKRALVRDIAGLTEDLDASVDYVLFAGDLVDSGKEEQYFDAHAALIRPLLESLHLTENEFFYVPGNHEVDRSRVAEITRDGLLGLNSRAKANRFCDAPPSEYLRGLSAYTDFVSLLARDKYHAGPNTGAFYRSHRLPGRIGLAAFNSAWRSWGGSDDYGRILISERQVDLALSELDGCDVRIALIHHPVECLPDFIRPAIKRRMSAFNLVCTGHLHDSESVRYVDQEGQCYVYSSSAALLPAETWPSGYTLIVLDLENRNAEIIVRAYSSERGTYLAAPLNGNRGSVVYQLPAGNLTAATSVDLRGEMICAVEGRVNATTISSISSSKCAPHSLQRIFVEPPLYDRSEYNQDPSQKEVTLAELLSSEDSVVFYGRKESGKTALLQYLTLRILEEGSSMPILMPFSHIPTEGLRRVHRSIASSLTGLQIKDLDVTSVSSESRTVLLLDDADLGDTKRVAAIRAYAEEHPGTRLLLTVSEDGYQELKRDQLPDFGVEMRDVYIHSLRARQVRLLAQRWFGDRSGIRDVREITERAVMNIRSILMPRTPMIVSLFLRIIESQSDFYALNNATVVEQFVLQILEKMRPDDPMASSIDFRHKEAFLACLARTMATRNEYSMTELEFEEFARSHFERISIEVPIKEFCGYLLTRGVLSQDGDRVFFRFRCFGEYFCAKAIIDDKDFEDFVLDQGNYLRFASELDYLSGIRRNNLSLVTLVGQRCDEALTHLPLTDTQLLDDAEVDQILLVALKAYGVREVDEEAVSERHDAILDSSPAPPEDQADAKPTGTVPPVEACFYNLLLYARLIRNCELLDGPIKKAALAKCVTGFCTLMAVWYQEGLDIVRSSDAQNKDRAKYLMSIYIPLVVQTEIRAALGTLKLAGPLKERMDESPSEFERFMYVAAIGDLGLPGYIDAFKKFSKSTENALLLELCLWKLLIYYRYRPFRRPRRSDLEAFIADLRIRARNEDRRRKPKIIADLRAEKDMSTFLEIRGDPKP